MKVRSSWLFVPGDSEKKLARGLESGAHALILDLEDAVAPGRKAFARGLVAEFIDSAAAAGAEAAPELWVRINPLRGGEAITDIGAAVRPGLAGIMLPKAEGRADPVLLGQYLTMAEYQGGVQEGAVGIFPVATETARAVLLLSQYAEGPIDRLEALTWGAEDIAADIGASANADEHGAWFEAFRTARSMALFAAHAARAQAVETLHVDIRDDGGLMASTRRARAEGFGGRIAIHPAQVPIINAAFTPGAEELERARAIVALFEADPAVGTIAFEGKMLDRPHLVQARRILAAAGAA